MFISFSWVLNFAFFLNNNLSSILFNEVRYLHISTINSVYDFMMNGLNCLQCWKNTENAEFILIHLLLIVSVFSLFDDGIWFFIHSIRLAFSLFKWSCIRAMSRALWGRFIFFFIQFFVAVSFHVSIYVWSSFTST